MFKYIFFRVPSLVFGQYYDCKSASEVTLNDMGKIVCTKMKTKYSKAHSNEKILGNSEWSLCSVGHTTLLIKKVGFHIMHFAKYIMQIKINSNGKVTWTQIARFLGPSWGPPGSYWPQMGPMLAQGKEESQPYSAADHCAGNLVSLDPRVQSCCLTLFSLFDHWLKIGSCGLFIQMVAKYTSVKGFRG